MATNIPRDAEPWTVYKLIWDFLDRGGKRFRPVLSMISCEAVGGDQTNVLKAATAIEIFHNFTLIHDDIEDNSLMRRGKPCVHIEYGIPLAINAGDGLLIYAWKSIIESELTPEQKVKAQSIIVKAFTKVLEGQGTELGWHTFNEWNITEDDYLKMIKGKTGELIAASCELGCYLGGGNEEQITALKEFGMSIGISFQVQDDILNLIGEEEKYQKEIGGDITEGKRTLMVIDTLSKCTPSEKEYLIKILDSHTTNQEEIIKVIELMKKYGSIDKSIKYAKKLIIESKDNLRKVLTDNPGTNKLMQMADFFINREC